MEENKNELLEEGTTPDAETVEETTDAVEEEVLEEAAETFETDEDVEEVESFDEESLEEEDTTEAEKYIDVKLLIAENAALKKANKLMKGIIAAIVAIALAFAIGFGGYKVYKTVYNPYNHMGYYNISGMTLDDFAEQIGMSVEEVVEEFQLPEDIKPDTYYDVVEYLIPVDYVAQMQFGVDAETVIQAFELGDEITGESTWGDALDTMPLRVYYGDEELLNEAIAEYNLGDDVTGDTLWGEVRPIVNKIEYERYLAQKAMDATEAE